MAMLNTGSIHLHYRLDGPQDGAPVVFINSLGTDLRLWDPILPHLPAGLRILRFDKRGHGLSDVPDGPYAMGALITDTETLMDHVGMKGALVVGLSIGGMIAQGLAVKRLDLVRAAVLSNTGAKIGTRAMWEDRIATVAEGGLSAVADATMERWFSKPFRDGPDFAQWRNLFLRTPAAGWMGCAAAIAGTDFMASTATLRLPVLGIAGSADGSTPPDLVRETTDLVPGSRFALMRGPGHIPCVEAPEAYAALIAGFLRETGHIGE